MVRSTSFLLRNSGIAAALWTLCLSGCNQSKPDRAESTALTGVGSKDAATCSSAQSDNHRLQSLRDVRVLDFGGTRMFVPKAWLTGYLDDGRSEADEAFRSIVSQRIKPPLDSEECPGTVHYFKVAERASRHGTMSFSPGGPLPLKPALREALQGTVVQMFVSARLREDIGKPIWFDEDVSRSPQSGWIRFRKFPIYKCKGEPGEAANQCTAWHDGVDATWLLHQWVTPGIGIGLVIQSDAEEPEPD